MIRALSDAEKAIYLEPLWPKGYFRKGRALSGLKVNILSNILNVLKSNATFTTLLKMYKEAEQAYERVLEFENTDDPELDEELNKVRILQLQEMGFSRTQSEAAIKNHLSVQAALESIFVISKTEKRKFLK